jgi:hypothetical protein
LYAIGFEFKNIRNNLHQTGLLPTIYVREYCSAN